MLVAEAVQEEVIGQVEGEKPETPESNPEQAPEAEPEENFDSLLAELLPEDATEETTGEQAGADSEADSLKGLTPQQILELGEQRGAEKTLGNLTEQTRSQQQINRENGLRNVLATSRQGVLAELYQAGIDPESAPAMRIIAKLDEVHGAHYAVKDADIKNATEAVVSQMRQALINEGVKRTGNKDFAANAIPEYVDTLVAHEVKSKGYKTASEVKQAVKDGQVAIIKRFKDLGLDPTGRVPNVPPARGVSGTQPKDDAEAAAWHASGKWDNTQMRAWKVSRSR